MRELQVSHQPVCAVVSASPPLAQAETVRPRDCGPFPLAMPSPTLAIRRVLDRALKRRELVANIPVESSALDFLRSYIQRENAVTFSVRSGLPRAVDGICINQLDSRDVGPIRTVPGQWKGRPLSRAVEKFADILGQHL